MICRVSYRICSYKKKRKKDIRIKIKWNVFLFLIEAFCIYIPKIKKVVIFLWSELAPLQLLKS